MGQTKPTAHLGRYWPIVVDVETGGVDAQTDALLEVAAIPLVFDQQQGWQLGDVLHYHITPFEGGKLVPEAMAIHGIKPDHPFRQAITEQVFCQEISQALLPIIAKNNCQRGILVGHNAHFDLGFLMAAARRCEQKLPIHSFTCFDTATMGAYWFGETVLARILSKAKIPFLADEAHSAIYDAEVTAKLVCYWLNRREGPGLFERLI